MWSFILLVHIWNQGTKHNCFFKRFLSLSCLIRPFFSHLLSLFLLEQVMDAFIKSQGGTVTVKDDRLVTNQYIAPGTILMKQTPLASVPQPTHSRRTLQLLSTQDCFTVLFTMSFSLFLQHRVFSKCLGTISSSSL